jgi:hypothetical protein
MGAIMGPSFEDSFFYLSGREPKDKCVEERKMLRSQYDTQRLYVNCRYLERFAVFTIGIPTELKKTLELVLF